MGLDASTSTRADTHPTTTLPAAASFLAAAAGHWTQTDPRPDGAFRISPTLISVSVHPPRPLLLPPLAG